MRKLNEMLELGGAGFCGLIEIYDFSGKNSKTIKNENSLTKSKNVILCII